MGRLVVRAEYEADRKTCQIGILPILTVADDGLTLALSWIGRHAAERGIR